jgi:AcrR family transcriptional regulator
MVGDATQTKKRLLDAAADEFAERGVAGARVDRIAQVAGCNKALIYSYFGSKEQLFEAVFEALVLSFVESTPIDVGDLPEYVGKLFDRYTDDPRVLRLAAWHQLERAASLGMPKVAQDANAKKHASLTEAQRTGKLSRHFTPEDLLTIIFGLSSMWGFVSLSNSAPLGSKQRAERRRVATEAMVRVLTDPER